MIEYTVKVFPNGDRFWYLNGKLHREDGPAVEYADGSKYWYLNGKLHREDGPAMELADGSKSWYLDDKRVSEKEHKRCTSPVNMESTIQSRHLIHGLSTDRGECCLSALQSSKGVEENWIDELGYYVQYAFDHCDELMEKFYPSIMQDFEFDEFYMSKSLCRLQVTPVCTAASMSLVISTPDYIEWVQTMEDSHDAAS